MNVLSTDLPGVLIIEPKIFGDSRGFFFEIWNEERYRQAGIPPLTAQDNISRSAGGVLRGLHFQYPEPQGKLVYVLQGEVFDVAVDIRHGSPTFGRWVSCVLSEENHRQFYIPEGFAHGFCVQSEWALFAYKCTRTYRPQFDAAVAWDDPRIGIEWPIREPLLSTKDRAAPRLADIPEDRLPPYEAVSSVRRASSV
jgi:dTDP-4-dehydrorhamnose 3,5-epimerase